MGPIAFRCLELSEIDILLPLLFKILHTNMSRIAPTDCSYEADLDVWLSYIVPVLKQEKSRIVLMYAGEELVGYFQYCIEDDTLRIDEVEIKPEYQRTMVFYRCCLFILSQLPPQVRYMTSYVHKNNRNSQSIHEKLGMKPIGENRSGTSWCYCGEIEKAAERIRR